MKKLAFALSLVLVAGVAFAKQAPKAAAKTADKSAAVKVEKTHDVPAEIVSVDPEKNTLTIKGETENKTVPVQGKAIAALKTVKAGDKLTLVCKDKSTGEHEAVIGIKTTAAHTEKPSH